MQLKDDELRALIIDNYDRIYKLMPTKKQKQLYDVIDKPSTRSDIARFNIDTRQPDRLMYELLKKGFLWRDERQVYYKQGMEKLEILTGDVFSHGNCIYIKSGDDVLNHGIFTNDGQYLNEGRYYSQKVSLMKTLNKYHGDLS